MADPIDLKLIQFFQLLVANDLQERDFTEVEAQIRTCITQNIDPLLTLVQSHLKSEEAATLPFFSNLAGTLATPATDILDGLELMQDGSVVNGLQSALLAKLLTTSGAAFNVNQKQ